MQVLRIVMANFRLRDRKFYGVLPTALLSTIQHYSLQSCQSSFAHIKYSPDLDLILRYTPRSLVKHAGWCQELMAPTVILIRHAQALHNAANMFHPWSRCIVIALTRSHRTTVYQIHRLPASATANARTSSIIFNSVVMSLKRWNLSSSVQ